MGNTPMGSADDLFTILGIFKTDPKSRNVKNSLQQLDFDSNSIQQKKKTAKDPPRKPFGNISRRP